MATPPIVEHKNAITFHDLTLLDAERQIVGRCLTDANALRMALEELPLDCCRSERGQDLARVFYALAGRLERGAFDPDTNEDDLAVGLAAFDQDRSADDWRAYLDDLWTPWTAAPSYLRGLLAALNAAYALHDGYIEAFRAYIEANPLTVSAGMEDDVFNRLRDVIVRRREQRYRKEGSERLAPPPTGDRKKGGRFVGGIHV